VSFVRVCTTSEVAPSSCREFQVAGSCVLICEYRGEYHAHSTICPHQGNPLDGALIWEGMIDCPWHHYEFDVVTGENRYPSRVYPAEKLSSLAWSIRPLGTFPLERRGDDIYVAFPSDRVPSEQTSDVQIRPARLEDAQRIAGLMLQLGYDESVDAIADRLQRRGAQREVFVAALGDGVIGWAAVRADEPFVEGFGAYLEGLVVDEAARSQGTGARLLDAAEAWARERECAEIRVQSNVVRKRAHAFYERQGYVTIKSQYQLRKPL
jgi:3-phenylpropionate/trans-cinnamate dioxygenase ferredoxin component